MTRVDEVVKALKLASKDPGLTDSKFMRYNFVAEEGWGGVKLKLTMFTLIIKIFDLKNKIREYNYSF